MSGALPDAVSLCRLYQSGAVDVADAIAAAFARIDALDGDINALWSLNRDGAHEQATIAQARYRSGKARPLEGVPLIVKDIIDTAALPTTYGSSIFAGHRPGRDAAAVTRLLDAGAILIGKAATDEFAWGITTANVHFGPTHNPWDTSRIPGGSSGGSAAGVSAGYAPIALGTDTAGSIRIPAGFCGVAGFKPSFGTVSSEGVFAMCPSLDHVGGIARSVRDLSLLHDNLSRLPSLGRSIKKVGIVRHYGGVVPEPAITEAIVQAATVLRSLGVETVDLTLDETSLYDTLAVTVLAEAAAGHRIAGRWPDQADAFGPDILARLSLSDDLGPIDYHRAQIARLALRNRVNTALHTVDAIIAPVSGVQPVAIDRPSAAHDGAELRRSVIEFTALASLTGLPALAMRAGFDGQGLPVGMQIIGAAGDDLGVLELGRRFEAATLEMSAREPAIAAVAAEIAA